ncbi:MAG: phosphate/phosphite/phosphonate ABC transporter substrate-binding protein [Eubacteriales bacterium]|nr:phosphate/phosphite/phosphonate ABC transporter substrate-binding protein [Eubacteriales bacterium]
MHRFEKRTLSRVMAILIAVMILVSGFGLGLASLIRFWQAERKVSAETSETDELVLGFVPLLEQEKLIESVEPLSKLLSDRVGQPVKAFTASSYVAVVEALGSGQVDFALIPPLAYVLAHQENGAEVILKALNKKGKSSYRSEILVRKDSGIEDVKDLKGKIIAFVDPSSSSGYVYPAAFLKQKGFDIDKDFDSNFTGGHDKALQSLLLEDADAACVYDDARLKLKEEFPQIMDETEVLAYTEDIPFIALAVRKDLDPKIIAKLKKTFLKDFSSGEGKELIADLFNLHGFTEAEDEDYDAIRKVAKLMDIKLDEE